MKEVRIDENKSGLLICKRCGSMKVFDLFGNDVGESKAIADLGFCPPLVIKDIVYAVIADNTKEEIIQENDLSNHHQ